MIYSTKHNKNTNEDPKTSVIFENLMLLPDNLFWEILKESTPNGKILPNDAGYLLHSDDYFWPHWNSKGNYDAGNLNFVEPDVFFRFSKFDIIIEAKLSDHSGQNYEEWEREFKSYLNEYREEKKPVYLFAVGGNSILNIEEPLIVDGYKCPIVKFTWFGILNQVYKRWEEIENRNYQESSIKRILKNIIEGFNLMGVYIYNDKINLKEFTSIQSLIRAFDIVIKLSTDKFELIPYGRKDITDQYYGVKFQLLAKGKDDIYLSLGVWFKDGLITVGLNNRDGWARKFCELIEKKKSLNSVYSKLETTEYDPDNFLYFEPTNKFNEEFAQKGSFDGQVDLLFLFVKEICMNYIE